MAKKRPKKSAKQYLMEVATDPEKLGKFILDPEGAMTTAKIPKKEQDHIKKAIAHYVHERLVKPQDAAYFIV